MFHSEIAEVVLAHCNIVNKDYQQDLIILYTFIPNKSLGQLLGFSRKMYIFKNLSFIISYLEAWFPEQHSKPLGIVDEINITLVMNAI